MSFFDCFLRLFIPSPFRIHPSGQPVKWGSLPVKTDLSSLPERYLASAMRAIDLWRVDGALCFAVQEGPVPAPVSVRLDEVGCDNTTNGRGETEYTITREYPLFVSCRVAICPQVEEHLLDAVMVHELGHCLGLVHTSKSWSIMQPVARAEVTEPSPQDLANLKTLYE